MASSPALAVRRRPGGVYAYDMLAAPWTSTGRPGLSQKAVRASREEGQYLGLIGFDPMTRSGLHQHQAPAYSYFLDGSLHDYDGVTGKGQMGVNLAGTTHDALAYDRCVLASRLEGPVLYPPEDGADGRVHTGARAADFANPAPEVPPDIVTDVARGDAPDSAIPFLLLGLSQVLLTGARLGAIQDVVLVEKFEPDPGPDVDTDPVRDGLARLFEGLDEYADVVDPVTSVELTAGSLSNDLASIVVDLVHGLQHHEAGRPVEALWWWQFSYLSSWGDRAASALRVLQSVLSHIRLDADEEIVAEAEFDALHT